MKICASTFLLSAILIPLPAMLQAQDFTWTTNANQITITGYTGPGGDVVIPDAITGWPVTVIGQQAFYNNTSVTGVTIPDSVTTIGIGAFLACTNLTSVAMGNGVTTLERFAFRFCTSLPSVSLGANLATVGESAFRECTSLTNVSFGPNVTTLAMEAFQECTSLTRVEIPDSVTAIGNAAFQSCSNLTDAIVGDGVTSIGRFAFAFCSNLSQLTFPSGLTTVGDSACHFCTSLTALRFKGNAPTHGSAVFSGTDNVTVFYLPGATGWEATFADRPTALWLPEFQAPGVRTNQFGFNIAWAEGMDVAVDAALQLSPSTWVPLATNTLPADTLYFADPDWTNEPARFYRLRWP